MAEAIAIHEALRMATMDKIVIEIYFQMVINSIDGLIKVPSQIINHVKDTVNLIKNFNKSFI